MVEPYKDPLGYKTKKVTLIMISVIGTAAVILGGWIGFNLFKYRQDSGLLADMAFPAQVAIINPQGGARAEVDEILTVDVMAIGPDPYNTIELWLNGEPVGVQTAPVGGAQPFTTQFSWHPIDVGYHGLMALGVDANGNKVLSSQVAVLIVPNEAGEESPSAAEGYSVMVPGIGAGAYTPPVVPGEGDSIYPAGNWTGSLGELATRLTADAKPAAPDLAVRPRDCAASLFIHDLSDNEEGFTVYRQLVNTPGWEQAAKISSQSQGDWLEYSDEGISGAVTYYVSAFNGQGESQSNPVLVNIDPENCAQKIESPEVESAALAVVLDDAQADQVYCYLSRDGENWSRWPTVGFLLPDDTGALPEVPIMVQRKRGSGTEFALAAEGLLLECWGWQGGALSKLGEIITGELQPDLTGKQVLIGIGITAKLVIKSEAASDGGAIFPVGDIGIPDLPHVISTGLIALPPLNPLDPDLPKATLALTYDREVCGQYIPPEAQNLLGKTLFCFPYPDYDPDQGAKSFQPYLVWGFDFEPVCIGGTGENCKTYWELLAMAEETGGEVGFTILGMTGGKKMVWNVTEPNLTMFVVPPQSCLGETDYSVRLWYRPGKEGIAVSVSPGDQISQVGEFEFTPAEIHYGPYSNWVSIPCLSPDLLTASMIEEPEEVAYLDVNFVSFDLTSVDDGDSGAQHVELYGYFRVKAPSMGHWETENCFTEWAGNCNHEPYWTNQYRYLNLADWETTYHVTEVYGGFNRYESGTYQLAEELVCPSDSKYNCRLNGQDTYFKYDNNRLRIMVKDQDVLKFQVMLIDYDEASDNDVQCEASFSSAPLVLYNILHFPDHEWSPFLVDDYTGCRVDAIISAAVP